MTDRVPNTGLEAQGIETGADVHWNLTTAPLVEHAVRRGEGLLAKDGPLVVKTGKHTGRSAKDRFIVRNSHQRAHGVVGQDQQADGRRRVRPAARTISSRRCGAKDKLFVADLYGGSQPEHRVECA